MPYSHTPRFICIINELPYHLIPLLTPNASSPLSLCFSSPVPSPTGIVHHRRFPLLAAGLLQPHLHSVIYNVSSTLSQVNIYLKNWEMTIAVDPVVNKEEEKNK